MEREAVVEVDTDVVDDRAKIEAAAKAAAATTWAGEVRLHRLVYNRP
jgi:hypothetical protein